MSYRINESNNLPGEIERVALEQIEHGLEELTRDTLEREKAIHQVRKRCKKVRGLLRLVRSDIGKTYSRENRTFRDAGRLLSGARDVSVIERLIDQQFSRYCTGDAGEAVFEHIRTALSERNLDTRPNSEQTTQRLQEVRKLFEHARVRLPKWSSRISGSEALLAGLEKSYGRGYEALWNARRNPTSDALHEWRKHAKYHWYHIRLLQGVWPALMKARAIEVNRLTELLGDVHDLEVFLDLIRSKPGLCGGSDRQAIIEDLTLARTTVLQEEVFSLGCRLYVNEPRQLREEMKQLINDWQAN